MPSPDPPVDPKFALDPPPLDGLVRRHDADGRLVEEASFRAGRLHGPFRLWGPDGSLRREAPHVDGLADGLATDYDETGQKLAETSWQAGLRHGEARLFTDGRLSQSMHWRAGRLDGPLHVFGPTGALVALMPYQAGRLHGTVQLYDPQGRLLLEAEHAHGRRHGPSVQYDADGRVVERVAYIEGRPKGAPVAVQSNQSVAPVAADPLHAFYAGLAREGAGKAD